jgi:hypothetical protein
MSDTTETRVTLSKRELHELRTALGAWVNAYNLMEDYLGMPEECITYDENPREGYISATEADALGLTRMPRLSPKGHFVSFLTLSRKPSDYSEGCNLPSAG